MALKDRVHPDSAAASAGSRALMAASLPLLAGHSEEPAAALRRAIGTSVLGRISSPEAAWLERIGAWRRELGSEQRVADLLQIAPELGATAPQHPPHHLASALPWWSIPRVWGRFLMRLVCELGSLSCLELGTGFGISGAYQAAALELRGKGRLTTLDVAGEWAAIAERGFSELGLDGRVDIRRGDIDETLEGVLEETSPVDYAFLDAEHTERATVRHFDAVIPHLAPGAVVVVDDILWSEEMRRAWAAIKRRDAVASATRLGRMGVVVASGG
jgi:predicted O-methyltransferase YrrM